MTKLSLVLWGSLMISQIGIAQSLERQAYLSGGDCATVGSIEYVFSFGEAVIGTDQTNLPSLTMGFQQPMPVTVLHEQQIQLQAKKVASDAQLSWVLEWNLEGSCQIFRMLPGRSWESMGEIAVEQQVVFEWVDVGIGRGEEAVSYQIRWAGMGGQQAYSEVMSLHFPRDQSATLSFFPNPARGRIQFHLPLQNGDPFTLYWYNAIGQLVGEEKKEYLNLGSGMGISTDQLARGSYVLVALYPGGRKQGRILLTD
ncbi:MAG: hypothetical protein AAF399_21300 [Bacteroidota bacterium]